MEEIRFPTKVRYHLGLPSSQARTMVLSDQAMIDSMGKFRASLTVVTSFESRLAPQSSSLGTDRDLRGPLLFWQRLR